MKRTSMFHRRTSSGESGPAPAAAFAHPGTRRILLVGVVAAGSLMALCSPAHAALTQISGIGVLDTAGECGPPPSGFDEFTDFTMVITGDLEGCWYSRIDTATSNGEPSGTYFETGAEVFVGSLNGGPQGTFTTTYRFESKWDVVTGAEVHGRCQHPIVAGSGTGGFQGGTGRVDFKDDVTTSEYHYRGHIALR